MLESTPHPHELGGHPCPGCVADHDQHCKEEEQTYGEMVRMFEAEVAGLRVEVERRDKVIEAARDLIRSGATDEGDGWGAWRALVAGLVSFDAPGETK
jgi:hypothetical protein